jgi:hypothetical protein
MFSMAFVTQGSFRTKKNSRDQRPAAALVWGLLATVLILVCVFLFTPKHDLTNSGGAISGVELPPYWGWLEAGSASTPQMEEAVRPVYTYSVIPGGVRNRKELKLVLARDPVAASHYKGFDGQAARPVRLDRARQVYVSYRLGNHIYWTSKKVTLPAGETLLSDGTHLVRTRCGNRISEVPAVPTADGEPSEPVLSAPVFPRATAETAGFPAPPPIWTEKPTTFMLAMGPTSSPPAGDGPFLSPLPFFPCCGGGSTHTPTPAAPPSPIPTPPPIIPPPGQGPSPNPPPPPVLPPVPTPEPNSTELLLLGIAGALLLLKFRRS